MWGNKLVIKEMSSQSKAGVSNPSSATKSKYTTVTNTKTGSGAQIAIRPKPTGVPIIGNNNMKGAVCGYPTKSMVLANKPIANEMPASLSSQSKAGTSNPNVTMYALPNPSGGAQFIINGKHQGVPTVYTHNNNSNTKVAICGFPRKRIVLINKPNAKETPASLSSQQTADSNPNNVKVIKLLTNPSSTSQVDKRLPVFHTKGMNTKDISISKPATTTQNVHPVNIANSGSISSTVGSKRTVLVTLSPESGIGRAKELNKISLLSNKILPSNGQDSQNPILIEEEELKTDISTNQNILSNIRNNSCGNEGKNPFYSSGSASAILKLLSKKREEECIQSTRKFNQQCDTSQSEHTIQNKNNHDEAKNASVSIHIVKKTTSSSARDPKCFHAENLSENDNNSSYGIDNNCVNVMENHDNCEICSPGEHTYARCVMLKQQLNLTECTQHTKKSTTTNVTNDRYDYDSLQKKNDVVDPEYSTIFKTTEEGEQVMVVNPINNCNDNASDTDNASEVGTLDEKDHSLVPTCSFVESMVSSQTSCISDDISLSQIDNKGFVNHIAGEDQIPSSGMEDIDQSSQWKIESVYSLATDSVAMENEKEDEVSKDQVDITVESNKMEKAFESDQKYHSKFLTFCLNESTWKQFVRPCFVVFERLPVEEKRAEISSKCSNYCRMRTLNLLCSMYLLNCDYNQNIAENKRYTSTNIIDSHSLNTYHQLGSDNFRKASPCQSKLEEMSREQYQDKHGGLIKHNAVKVSQEVNLKKDLRRLRFQITIKRREMCLKKKRKKKSKSRTQRPIIRGPTIGGIPVDPATFVKNFYFSTDKDRRFILKNIEMWNGLHSKENNGRIEGSTRFTTAGQHGRTAILGSSSAPSALPSSSIINKVAAHSETSQMPSTNPISNKNKSLSNMKTNSQPALPVVSPCSDRKQKVAMRVLEKYLQSNPQCGSEGQPHYFLVTVGDKKFYSKTVQVRSAKNALSLQSPHTESANALCSQSQTPDNELTSALSVPTPGIRSVNASSTKTLSIKSVDASSVQFPGIRSVNATTGQLTNTQSTETPPVQLKDAQIGRATSNKLMLPKPTVKTMHRPNILSTKQLVMSENNPYKIQSLFDKAPQESDATHSPLLHFMNYVCSSPNKQFCSPHVDFSQHDQPSSRDNVKPTKFENNHQAVFSDLAKSSSSSSNVSSQTSLKRSSSQTLKEQRIIKRRRLEAKYPLPPGVVIKSEPITEGYDLDNNWSATSGIDINCIQQKDTNTEQCTYPISSQCVEHGEHSQTTQPVSAMTTYYDDDDMPPMPDDMTLHGNEDSIGSTNVIYGMPPILQPIASSLPFADVEVKEDDGPDDVTGSTISTNNSIGRRSCVLNLNEPFTNPTDSHYESGYDSVSISSSSELLSSSSSTSLHDDVDSTRTTSQVGPVSASRIQQLKELLKKRQMQVENMRKIRSTIPLVDLDSV